jgi:hypothetical protein
MVQSTKEGESKVERMKGKEGRCPWGVARVHSPVISVTAAACFSVSCQLKIISSGGGLLLCSRALVQQMSSHQGPTGNLQKNG